MMRLLANENFPLESVRLLIKSGYDIKAIGIDNPSISDSQVMQIAIDEKRTILTFDRDYGELIFKVGFKPPDGVIFFRWDTFKPDEPACFLIQLFEKSEIEYSNALTVIDSNSIRQRKY